MNKLELISPSLFVSDRIAVVGSSGLLLGSNKGIIIDNFDDVVRFNRAPNEGFEDDVGSRTTIRVVNNHVFNNNKLPAKVWTNQPANFVRDLRYTKIVYFAGDGGPWNARAKNTDESCELYRFQFSLMNSLQSAVGYSGKPFTVGVGFIATCVVSGVKPFVFGFDVEPRRRDHYWEDCPPPGGIHNRSAEQELLERLHEEGRIVLCP